MDPRFIKRAFFTIFTLFTLQGCTQGNGNIPVIVEEAPQTNPSIDTPAISEEIAAASGLEKLIYHIGPVDLEPQTETETMLDRPLIMRFQLDAPMWVIGFEPRVVDGNGKELPSELLQRALLSNMNEENLLCSKGSSGNPFAIATSQLTKITFPKGYGYPILPQETIEAEVLFKNMSEENYTDVFYEIVLLAKPMNEFTALKDLKPIFMEFDPCQHKPVEIEPESFGEREKSFTLSQGGTLFVALGILQDFGTSLTLTQEGIVEPLWRTEAIVDEKHRVDTLINNPFEDPAGIPLKEGGKLELAVGFDNTSDRWINDALPGVMLYIAAEE